MSRLSEVHTHVLRCRSEAIDAAALAPPGDPAASTGVFKLASMASLDPVLINIVSTGSWTEGFTTWAAQFHAGVLNSASCTRPKLEDASSATMCTL